MINQLVISQPWDHGTSGQTPYIIAKVLFLRKEAMAHPRLLTIGISAVLTAAVLSGMASHASAQVAIPANRNAIQQNELQMLQNRLQRQQFQQEQQFYREQDRQVVPKPRPDVPVVKPSCQSQVIGNTISRVCR